MEDLPAYLCRRLADAHDLTPPLGYGELRRVILAAGVRIEYDDGLTGWGLYVPGRRIIVLRHGVPVWVVAHEFAHAVLEDADPETLDGRWYGTEESFCDAFASLLCGPRPASLDYAAPPPLPTDAPPVRQPPPYDPRDDLRRLLDLWAANP